MKAKIFNYKKICKFVDITCCHSIFAAFEVYFFFATGEKHCDDDALAKLISINAEQPYKHLQTLQGRYLGNFTYVVTNSSAQSLVKIGVAKHSSILFSLYPGATLKEGSLKGNISHNSTHWNLNVSGEVVSCPGKSLFGRAET